MTIQPLSPSSAVSPTETLVISRDSTLVNELRRALQEVQQTGVIVASTFSEAQSALERQRPEAVFIDFRSRHCADNPSALLRQLGESGGVRMPVIALSDTGYVCDWAAVADLIVDGHLRLPLDREQLARLFDSELAKARFDADLSPASPRVLRGTTISFRTYTPSMYQLLDDLETMALHDVTVLLVGETGTGKTTLAKLIHELSPRRDTRFLNVACGALPPELIEAELFGHTKGAFTSADHARIGKFEVAKGGSLLLDEIDVLDLAKQAKLLRVIETGEFEPVGSNDTRTSLARLIVASNVDLKELMDRNLFRADLYYRLNMMEYRIPPLRERRRDIVPLALDFIEDFCRDHQVTIRSVHPDFLTCLKTYSWPGNVRELKNHIRRAVLFCRNGILSPRDLAPHFRREAEAQIQGPDTPASSSSPAAETTIFERVATSERHILEQALREHDHNRTATARALGLSRVGLYKKMKKYGMITPRNGTCPESN